MVVGGGWYLLEVPVRQLVGGEGVAQAVVDVHYLVAHAAATGPPCLLLLHEQIERGGRGVQEAQHRLTASHHTLPPPPPHNTPSHNTSPPRSDRPGEGGSRGMVVLLTYLHVVVAVWPSCAPLEVEPQCPSHVPDGHAHHLGRLLHAPPPRLAPLHLLLCLLLLAALVGPPRAGGWGLVRALRRGGSQSQHHGIQLVLAQGRRSTALGLAGGRQQRQAQRLGGLTTIPSPPVAPQTVSPWMRE